MTGTSQYTRIHASVKQLVSQAPPGATILDCMQGPHLMSGLLIHILMFEHHFCGDLMHSQALVLRLLYSRVSGSQHRLK